MLIICQHRRLHYHRCKLDKHKHINWYQRFFNIIFDTSLTNVSFYCSDYKDVTRKNLVFVFAQQSASDAWTLRPYFWYSTLIHSSEYCFTSLGFNLCTCIVFLLFKCRGINVNAEFVWSLYIINRTMLV